MKKIFYISLLILFSILLLINCSSSTSSSVSNKYSGTWVITNMKKYSGPTVQKVSMRLECDSSGAFSLYSDESTGSMELVFKGTVYTENNMFTMHITEKMRSGSLTNSDETFRSKELFLNGELAITVGGENGPPMAMMLKKTDSSSGWTGQWLSYTYSIENKDGIERVSHSYINLYINETQNYIIQKLTNVVYTNGIQAQLNTDIWKGMLLQKSPQLISMFTQTNGYPIIATPLFFTNDYKLVTQDGVQHLCMPGTWIRQ